MHEPMEKISIKSISRQEIKDKEIDVLVDNVNSFKQRSHRMFVSGYQ